MGNDGVGIYYADLDCSDPMQYTITITRCFFMNNAARQYRTVGGAIYFRKFCGAGPGSVFVTNSSFINNRADYFGAVYLFGYLPNFRSNFTFTLENCKFINNSAVNGNCGAVGLFTPTRIKINFTRNIFMGNRATGSTTSTYDDFYVPTGPFGGGAVCIRNGSVITLDSNTFSHNTVDTRPGGAMFIGDSTELIIRSSNFSDNRAEHSSADGGAIYTVNATEIQIETSTFLENIAGRDGGVIYKGENPSVIEVTQTIFSRNSAERNGGVMYVAGGGNQVSINASVFSFNDANGRGGAIRISSSMLDITETNIYNNTAEFGRTIFACDSTVIVRDILDSIPDPQTATCIQYDGFIRIYSHQEVTTPSVEVTTAPLELQTTTPAPMAETTTQTNIYTVQTAQSSTPSEMTEVTTKSHTEPITISKLNTEFSKTVNEVTVTVPPTGNIMDSTTVEFVVRNAQDLSEFFFFFAVFLISYFALQDQPLLEVLWGEYLCCYSWLSSY